MKKFKFAILLNAIVSFVIVCASVCMVACIPVEPALNDVPVENLNNDDETLTLGQQESGDDAPQTPEATIVSDYYSYTNTFENRGIVTFEYPKIWLFIEDTVQSGQPADLEPNTTEESAAEIDYAKPEWFSDSMTSTVLVFSIKQSHAATEDNSNSEGLEMPSPQPLLYEEIDDFEIALPSEHERIHDFNFTFITFNCQIADSYYREFHATTVIDTNNYEFILVTPLNVFSKSFDAQAEKEIISFKKLLSTFKFESNPAS